MMPRVLIVKKIVSGGQTGADRAALDAAIESGIAHGGWLPKGRRTEEGALSERYQLKEMNSTAYHERTRQNVLDSDGTVIFFHHKLSGGSLLTADLAKELGKPCLTVDLGLFTQEQAVEQILAWLVDNGISVVNVAGPRASGDPNIYTAVKRLLHELFIAAER